MKFTHLMKLALLLAAVSLQLACLKTPGSPEPSNFGPARPERLNLEPINGGSTPYPNYASGEPVRTADGRIVLVKPGTWEVISTPQPKDVIGIMANGQKVLIRPDGTWMYLGSRGRDTSTTVRPTSKSKPLPPPPATVYFYQLDGDGGNGKATVFVNNTPIAALRSKRFFAIRVPPGQHVFTVSKTSQNPIMMNIAAGKTYYMRNKGGLLTKEKLIRESAEEGTAAINKLKVINGMDVNTPDIMVEPRMSN